MATPIPLLNVLQLISQFGLTGEMEAPHVGRSYTALCHKFIYIYIIIYNIFLGSMAPHTPEIVYDGL